MLTKIQGKCLDENRAKMTKKWKKNCVAKYGVVEESQNQNGVVFFSNLKLVAKIVLVKLEIYVTYVSIV